MKTIVTRLTPAMPAAIATLGIAGPGALAAVENFVRLPNPGLKVGGVRFATWRIPLQQSAIQRATEQRATEPITTPAAQSRLAGEHVVLTRPAEDRIEVHCHGGAAVCQRLLSDLVHAGCVSVAPDQWPSGLRCPLSRAAEHDLLLATTDRAAAVLLDQMNGALRRGLLQAQRQLIDRDLAGLRELLSWANFGAHLSQPWKIVLAGPPNVGKSSLLNALAGTRQAIVHHEPGTTRDWLQWPSAVEGWPVVFTDTAGVRQSSEEIEQAGVERGLGQLREADLAVLVVDAQQGWTTAHTQLLALSPPRRLIVYNKVDLEHVASSTRRLPPTSSPVAESLEEALEEPFAGSFDELGKASSHRSEPLAPSPEAAQPLRDQSSSAPRPAPLWTSAVEGTGIEELLRAICETLVPTVPPMDTAIPFRAEQIQYLKLSWTLAQTKNWAAAAEVLGECLSEPTPATLGASSS